MSDDAPDGPDGEAPIPPAEALKRLPDDAFTDLVAAVWERRDWTAVEERDREAWYVDLLFQTEWPTGDRALLRVHLPESKTRVGKTEIRHFTRAVQREGADTARLVTTTDIPQSIRSQAAEFGIGVVDAADVAALIAETGLRDRLERAVGPPVATAAEKEGHLRGWLVDRLDRHEVPKRLARALERRLPPDPTAAGIAPLTYTGFRTALAAAAAAFLLTFAVTEIAWLYWLLWGVFLAVTYGALFPAMALDIFLVRRARAVGWTPTWLLLASFLLAPLSLLVGGFYWYRRRQSAVAAAATTGASAKAGDG